MSINEQKMENENLVLDREKQFVYMFQIDKLRIFHIGYKYLGQNKTPHFSTSADKYYKSKRNIEYGGQAQEEVLNDELAKVAYDFYEKFDKYHIGVLNKETYQEIMKEIEELKKSYNFLERKGLPNQNIREFGNYEEVEFSKQTPKHIQKELDKKAEAKKARKIKP